MGVPNDDYLREEILDVLYDAEEQKLRYPSAAIHNVGRCLELACRYRLNIGPDSRPALLDLLKHPTIVGDLGEYEGPAHVLREARNEAAHGLERFEPDQAQTAVAVMKVILPRLGINPARPEPFEAPSPNGSANGQPKAPPGRIVPDWGTINGWTGQMALTEGERYLVELFDKKLGDQWRIFVQPYFLGLRPDIVLLNTKQQVIHVEVKDWKLEGLYWRSKTQLCDGRFAGRAQIRGNPVLQASLVRNRFLDGPLAGWNEQGRASSILKSFLYFHNGSKAEAIELFEDKARQLSIKILHREDVDQRGVVAFTTASRRQFGGPQSEAVLKSLEPYLGLPEFVKERLTAQPAQGRFCRTKWDRPKSQPSLFSDAKEPEPIVQTFERVRGGAGTGKSHIVALRAAKATAHGKKVLVTSYHITMANYLYGLVRRALLSPEGRENILVRHFHGFLFDQQVEAGIAPEPGETTNQSITDIVESLFAEESASKFYWVPKFDAIYIDEGQDFDAEQIQALHRFLSPDGELVLFADGRQDVHGRFRLWKRLPVPFRAWRQLNGNSQRLPDFVARWLNLVAAQNRVGDEADPPLIPAGNALPGLEGGDFYPLWWADLESEVAGVEAVPCAVRLIQKQFPDVHPSDIVVLTHRRQIGTRIVGVLCRDFGQNTVKHIFGDTAVADMHGSDNGVVRKQKVAFHEADGRFKACTIHSFKGWEAQHVILLWTPIQHQTEEDRAKIASLFYTGASRCRRSMVILNVDPNYRQFRNETWNDFMGAIGEEEQARWRQRVSAAAPIVPPKVRVDDYDPFADNE